MLSCCNLLVMIPFPLEVLQIERSEYATAPNIKVVYDYPCSVYSRHVHWKQRHNSFSKLFNQA